MAAAAAAVVGAAAAPLAQWSLNGKGALVLTNASSYGLHPLGNKCAIGTEVVLGESGVSGFVTLDAANGVLRAAASCPGVCVSAALVLADCGDAAAGGWSARPGDVAAGPGGAGPAWRARGRFVEPYD